MADCEQLIKQYETTLSETSEKMGEMEDMLRRIMTGAQKIATVIERIPEGLLLSDDQGQKMLVADVPDLKLESGDIVAVHPMTGQIIRKIPITELGAAGEIRQLHLDGMLAEVDVNGQVYITMTGKYAGQAKVGDKVTVDHACSIVQKLIPTEESPYHLNNAVQVKWDEVGGLSHAKQLLREAIEYPIKFKKQYDHYNKRAVKGILLWGPPGCGKTLLAKALATSLADLQGKDIPGYIYIKGPEILDKYVGVTEQIIRHLFKAARTFGAEHKTRAVLFIDEADALLRKRGSGRSSDIESTIVPAFLAEMDGMSNDATDPLVLLATNRPDTLDSAVTRDGRVDRKIKVGRPERETVREIFNIHLRQRPTKDPNRLVDSALEHLYRDRPLYRLEIRGQREPVMFHYHHMISGAAVAGIVDRAVSVAFRRDIANNTTTGVLPEDMVTAVNESFEESRGMDHNGELEDFAEGLHVSSISRA